IVFAGGESLLEKEALAAAARGCVDCQDAALILALDCEGVLVVEREVIAGDFNRRAIRTLRHIEAAELYIQRSARAYSERLSFDRKIVELEFDTGVRVFNSKVADASNDLSRVLLRIDDRIGIDAGHRQVRGLRVRHIYGEQLDVGGQLDGRRRAIPSRVLEIGDQI